MDAAAGLQFTFGGMNPTIPFDFLHLDVFQAGEDSNFTGNIFLRSFRGNQQLGQIVLDQGFTGSPTVDSTEWNKITHFTATFGTPGEEAPDGGRLVIDNLKVNPVLEP